jgi:hypothetical protein
MVERSVEQSVPPAGSGPRDFTTARLNRALMHASAAAGVVRGEEVSKLGRIIMVASDPNHRCMRAS